MKSFQKDHKVYLRARILQEVTEENRVTKPAHFKRRLALMDWRRMLCSLQLIEPSKKNRWTNSFFRKMWRIRK